MESTVKIYFIDKNREPIKLVCESVLDGMQGITLILKTKGNTGINRFYPYSVIDHYDVIYKKVEPTL
jgi:hypothetical protein